jgi:hypothetical protein
MFHYIYNRPRPYRYSNMSSSNLAIHIKQSSFGIEYTQTSLCMVQKQLLLKTDTLQLKYKI